MYISAITQLIILDICMVALFFALIIWTNSRIDAIRKRLRDLESIDDIDKMAEEGYRDYLHWVKTGETGL